MKLYKYRPLSDLLFKELHYQEIYFASYSELNDPLDLSATIEFTPESQKHVEQLVYFIIKTTDFFDVNASDKKKVNSFRAIDFYRNIRRRNIFIKNIYNEIVKQKTVNDFISYDIIEDIIKNIAEKSKLGFIIDYNELRNEIYRITDKFLKNSYVSCFSGNNNDFLMWSHYSSKHQGICLEFDTDQNSGLFPYEIITNRNKNHELYLKRMSDWDTKVHMVWDTIKRVIYVDEQPHVNFFDFSPMFFNEGDLDLIHFTKSKWHGFAYELQRIFSTKTKYWAYENEYRAIEININTPINPEQRIRRYPIEVLSGIYFGYRTVESDKIRIYNIFKNRKNSINYYNSILSKDGKLHFTKWVEPDE